MNPSRYLTDACLLTDKRNIFNNILHSLAAQDSKTAVMYYDLAKTLGKNNKFAVPEFPRDDRDVIDDVSFWKSLIISGAIDLVLAPCSCTDYNKKDPDATAAQVDGTHYLSRLSDARPGVVKINLPVMKITKTRTALCCPACGKKVLAPTPAEALLNYNHETAAQYKDTEATTNAIVVPTDYFSGKKTSGVPLGKAVSLEQHLKNKSKTPRNKAAEIQRKLQTRLRSLVLYCFDQAKITPRWDRQNIVLLYKEDGEYYAIEVQHDVKTGTQHFAAFKNPQPSDYVYRSYNKEVPMGMIQSIEPQKLCLTDGQAVLYYGVTNKEMLKDDNFKTWTSPVDIAAGVKAKLIPARPKIAEAIK